MIRRLWQVHLRSEATHLTVWVDLPVRKHQFLTFAKVYPGLIWEVMEVYTSRPADQIHTDWHNNI